MYVVGLDYWRRPGRSVGEGKPRARLGKQIARGTGEIHVCVGL